MSDFIVDETLLEMRLQVEERAMWYRELFEGMPMAALVTRPDGAVTHANTAACLLLRRPLNGLTCLPLSSFVPVEQRRAFDTMLDLVRRTAHVADFALSVMPRGEAPVDCRAWARAVVTLGEPSPVLVWTFAPLVPAF
jgi:PAS domain-containing protein